MRRFTILVALLSFCFAPRAFAGPATEADVRALIAQLGDDNATTREKAEAMLRALPATWRATLRKAAEAASDPEVKSRLTAVVSAMGLLQWRSDAAAAIGEAHDRNKPLLVFATAGGPDGFS